MAARAIRIDLALLGEGLKIGWEFGARSLVELARIAEYIERSVYEPGSLVAISEGLRFRLLNPPLRLGAFHSVRLFREGVEVDAERATIRVGPAGAPRPLARVAPSAPVELLPGVPIEFTVPERAELGATVRFRLELHCSAIPPRIWMEFHDRVGPEGPR